MTTIDENSLRALRALTSEEIALLSDGGDVEAFEVRVQQEVWKANQGFIDEFRASHPDAKCLWREIGEEGIVVFFFTDPYVAFEFKMHCG